MLRFFRSRTPAPERQPIAAAVPDGQRVYAVGDIHGRSDLFISLIEAIEHDNRDRGPAETTVILLGDLVDRGPDSVNVIALAREWQKFRNVRILTGNHEEMFLKSMESLETLRHFLRHGGRETLLSYGVDKKEYTRASIEDVQAMMVAKVPRADIDFISRFEDMIEIGDYLFVHAGVEPGVPLAEQSTARLRWIREPFLSHEEPYERVVIHGHTIAEKPADQGNRIGIDTGAYASGQLTALVLEGDSRRYITAVDNGDGEITTATEQMGH